jgi:putative transposase
MIVTILNDYALAFILGFSIEPFEEFYGEADHVYRLVLYPPRIALFVLVNSLKGVSSRRLRQNFDIFKKECWGENVALWSRSYFVASVGGSPIELLKQYIEQQNTPK